MTGPADRIARFENCTVVVALVLVPFAGSRGLHPVAAAFDRGFEGRGACPRAAARRMDGGRRERRAPSQDDWLATFADAQLEELVAEAISTTAICGPPRRGPNRPRPMCEPRAAQL